MKAVEISQITSIAEPVVAGQGYDLVDLEWKHEAGSWVLRAYIDRSMPGPETSLAGSGSSAAGASPRGGVTLEDCAQVSRELSAALDVADTIKVAYTLEVSSPGLNRPLKREADFRRFIGQKAKIRTRHPVGDQDRRNFSGRLVAVDAGKVSIDVGDRTYEVPVDEVEKANLVFEF